MGLKNQFFQRFELGLQGFEEDSKFVVFADVSFPFVDGEYRTFDLGAGCESIFDRGLSDSVRFVF